jgi:uncharacterized membrane protein
MPDFISIRDDAKHNAEQWTGRILRVGVWASAGLMILGLLLAALAPASINRASTTPSLGELAVHLWSKSFDPVTLMFAGLVLLMFTPILRVITAIAAFASERDWRFVLVSIIVFLLLGGEIVYSILLKG